MIIMLASSRLATNVKYLLLAAAVLPLSACMTINAGAAGDGKRAELCCLTPSSGEWHFWIYSPDGNSKTEHVQAADTKKLIALPPEDIKVCWQTTSIESIFCVGANSTLTAEGYLRIVTRG